MEMLERVARATFHAESEPHKAETGYKDLWDWLDVMPAVRERHLAMARAAIEAMREPTEAMTDAINDTFDPAYGEWGDNCHVTDKAWEAMIDAALKS